MSFNFEGMECFLLKFKFVHKFVEIKDFITILPILGSFQLLIIILQNLEFRVYRYNAESISDITYNSASSNLQRNVANIIRIAAYSAIETIFSRSQGESKNS